MLGIRRRERHYRRIATLGDMCVREDSLVCATRQFFPGTRSASKIFEVLPQRDLTKGFRIYLTDEHHFIACEIPGTASELQSVKIYPLTVDQAFDILIQHGVRELRLPGLQLGQPA